MSYFISTKNRIEGFHRWPGADEDCAFLRSRHRHIFEIKCKKAVNDFDREVEIITKQKEIDEYISERFGRPAEFKDMSCEQIAEELCVHFNFDLVEVLEDGISGGGYER